MAKICLCGGEQAQKQNPPQIQGQSREYVVLRRGCSCPKGRCVRLLGNAMRSFYYVYKVLACLIVRNLLSLSQVRDATRPLSPDQERFKVGTPLLPCFVALVGDIARELSQNRSQASSPQFESLALVGGRSSPRTQRNRSSQTLRSFHCNLNIVGDWDRGGQNVPNDRGGELAPPKLRVFKRNSVEKGQISGPLKIQNFHPPL